MNFSEIASAISEISKPENKGGFNIDKRVEISSTHDVESEGKFDINKRAGISLNHEADSNEVGHWFDPYRRTNLEWAESPREIFSEGKSDINKNAEVFGNKEIEGEKNEISDPVREKIEKSIGTVDGLEELIEKHPEKRELWDSMRDALDTLNDPEASALEIKSAQGKISSIKGQIMEIATKDALAEAGFDVESTQRTVKGENGDTKPDVIAHNNTDKPIEALGTIIQPGESLSVECKCARSDYLNNQLSNHIPNQLSGHEGTSVLLTTSDIEDTVPGLAKQVCDKYNTKLVVADMSVRQVDNTIREVFGK